MMVAVIMLQSVFVITVDTPIIAVDVTTSVIIILVITVITFIMVVIWVKDVTDAESIARNWLVSMLARQTVTLLTAMLVMLERLELEDTNCADAALITDTDATVSLVVMLMVSALKLVTTSVRCFTKLALANLINAALIFTAALPRSVVPTRSACVNLAHHGMNHPLICHWFLLATPILAV